jgi:hypothetical protein
VDALFDNSNKWLDPITLSPLDFIDFPDFNKARCPQNSALAWFPYLYNGNATRNKYGLLNCKNPLNKFDVLCFAQKKVTPPPPPGLELNYSFNI